jgi:hypothetical protein
MRRINIPSPSESTVEVRNIWERAAKYVERVLATGVLHRAEFGTLLNDEWWEVDVTVTMSKPTVGNLQRASLPFDCLPAPFQLSVDLVLEPPVPWSLFVSAVDDFSEARLYVPNMVVAAAHCNSIVRTGYLEWAIIYAESE